LRITDRTASCGCAVKVVEYNRPWLLSSESRNSLARRQCHPFYWREAILVETFSCALSKFGLAVRLYSESGVGLASLKIISGEVMPQYLVAIHHADGYEPAFGEDLAMERDIDALNEEMVAAGVRFFAGGLKPARLAKSVRAFFEMPAD
jgi:hypothetical protein